MEKERKQMAGRILNFTLEIIYLLTGEDYIVVKKISEEGERWTRNQDPIMVSERSSYQEILELTNKMTELLTGEVPIRCQDVTVYFSMEEWEYIEEHKDEYEDTIIENRQTVISLDKFIKEEKPERYSIPLPSKGFRKGSQGRQRRRETASMASRKVYRRMGINVGALISEVQARPELWDKSASGYTDRHRRRRAWESICKALYPHWSGFSESLQGVIESDLRKRWKSVRDRFLKEERNARRSGTPPSQRSRVPFHDELLFILPKKGFHSSKGNSRGKDSVPTSPSVEDTHKPKNMDATALKIVEPTEETDEDSEDKPGPSKVEWPPTVPGEATTAAATRSAAGPVDPTTYPVHSTRSTSTHWRGRRTLGRVDQQLDMESEALSLIRSVDDNDLFDYFGYGIASCCRQMRTEAQQDFISFVYAAAAFFNSVFPLPELGDLINSLWSVTGMRNASSLSQPRRRVVSTSTQTEPVTFSPPAHCLFPSL
ncbi:uncharacterized protein RB166_018839 isoform 1-T2 [Leptodactylus fuscus]